MSLVLIGTALGLIGAFLLTRLMTGLLFGVSPTDPLSFVLVFCDFDRGGSASLFPACSTGDQGGRNGCAQIRIGSGFRVRAWFRVRGSEFGVRDFRFQI